MKDLIIISQIQRSGGTLLSQLFDGHPACSVYPGECMLLKGKWPKIRTLYYRKRLFNVDDRHFKRYVDDGYDRSSKGEKIEFEFDFQKRDAMFNPGIFHLNKSCSLNSLVQSLLVGLILEVTKKARSLHFLLL